MMRPSSGGALGTCGGGSKSAGSGDDAVGGVVGVVSAGVVASAYERPAAPSTARPTIQLIHGWGMRARIEHECARVVAELEHAWSCSRTTYRPSGAEGRHAAMPAF